MNKYVLEKLALEQFNNKANKKTIDFSKEVGFDKDRIQDLELIQKVQNENDIFALNRLVSRCSGLISKVVNEANIKNVSFDLAYKHAEAELKRSIKAYDLKKYKSVKPSTYFTNNMKLELKKLNSDVNSQSIVRMADDLNNGKVLIHNASSILTPMLGRKPTNEELYNYIKNETNYGNYLTMDKIEKINKYTTIERSGSQFISKGNADGAETLTYEDVTNRLGDRDQIRKMDREEEVINAIRDFTKDRKTRRFIIAFLGLGQFKNEGIKGSIGKAALRTGFSSYYDGKKVLTEFTKYCRENGVWNG